MAGNLPGPGRYLWNLSDRRYLQRPEPRMLIGVPGVAAAEICGRNKHRRGESMPLEDRRDRCRHVGVRVIERDQDGAPLPLLELVEPNRPKSASGKVGHLLLELTRADKEITLDLVAPIRRLHDGVVHEGYAGRRLKASSPFITSSKALRALSCMV